MRIFIIGATGVLGCALTPCLQQEHHGIRTLVRSSEQARTLHAAGMEATVGEILRAETQQRLPELLKGCEAVIHIATAPSTKTGSPKGGSLGEKRGARLYSAALLTAGAAVLHFMGVPGQYPQSMLLAALLLGGGLVQIVIAGVLVIAPDRSDSSPSPYHHARRWGRYATVDHGAYPRGCP